MPDTFTTAVAEAICDRLVEGRSLRSICQDADMPAVRTVLHWLAARPSFRDQYGLAREAQGDALFEECLAIADDASGDTKLSAGREVANTEFVSRSRLRVETRKWMAAKLAPKKYGEGSAAKPVAGEGLPLKVVIRWAETRAEATDDPSMDDPVEPS